MFWQVLAISGSVTVGWIIANSKLAAKLDNISHVLITMAAIMSYATFIAILEGLTK
jgi:hypothetical protein